jgi:UPF0271 protein
MSTTEKKVIVLDTSAFIAGFDPSSIKNKQYSVPLVKEELTSTAMSWTRFKTAVENGRIEIRTPNVEFVRKVQQASKKLGNSFFLSKVDKQILALALQLKNEKQSPLIVTDDYSIQNVADQIGVEFAPLMTFGIRFQFKWIRYCPACFHKYPPDYPHKKCEICGTELKRKPLNKKSLRGK